MFDKKVRQKLDHMASQLQNWMKNLPKKELHKQCERLYDEIETERRRSMWRIIDRERLQALTIRYEELNSFAELLDEIIKQARPLSSELDVVRKIFANEPSPTKEYGKKICDRWRNELAGVLNYTRQADLITAKHRLRVVEESLRLHTEALLKFQEADEVLRNLRPSTESAVLTNTLRTQREAIEQGQLSKAGISKVKDLCKPLEELSKRPEPPEIKMVSLALTGIRAWNRALNLTSGEGQDLEKRYRQLEIDWRVRDTDEPEQLLEEAKILRADRIRQAHCEREDKLRVLEDSLSDLMLACGPQPEIERSLESLKHTRFERANEHISWMERLNKASQEFKAIANTHDLALEKRLDERCAEWKAGLEVLYGTPLTQALRQEANALQQRLDKLKEVKSAQDLLVSLREANDCLKELEGLKQQAEAVWKELDDTRNQLCEDNARLQTQAAKVGIECENLQESIDTLADNAGNDDLDQAFAEARTLQQKLDNIRKAFILDCESAWHDSRLETDRLYEALHQAGFANAPRNPPCGAWPTDAEQCVNRLAEQFALHPVLEKEVEQAAFTLQQQCDAQRDKLSNLLKDDPLLSFEHKERVLTLLDNLKTVRAVTGLERLEELSEMHKSCETFWTEFLENEKKLCSRVERLKDRLQLFNQERLKAYCPAELFDQVSDWIRGIPEEPKQTHVRQLKETEDFLQILEGHCRRWIAEQIGRQVTQLSQNKHRHSDPQTAVALLIEIEQIGPARHLPYEVRRRLDETAMRATGG